MGATTSIIQTMFEPAVDYTLSVSSITRNQYLSDICELSQRIYKLNHDLIDKWYSIDPKQRDVFDDIMIKANQLKYIKVVGQMEETLIIFKMTNKPTLDTIRRCASVDYWEKYITPLDIYTF